MNAYQCDRCHGFFPYGVNKPEEDILNTARRSYKYVRIQHIEGNDICDLDLCPSCKKSFEHWFENPYIDEEISYKEKKVNRNE